MFMSRSCLIAAATVDKKLYNDAIKVLKSMTSDEDNVYNGLDTTSPLYGSSQYEGRSSAFNDLNMLIGYLMGNPDSGTTTK